MNNRPGACSSDDHHWHDSDSDHATGSDIQALQRTFSDEELVSVFSWFIDGTGNSTQPDSEAIIFKFVSVDPRRAPGRSPLNATVFLLIDRLLVC